MTTAAKLSGNAQQELAALGKNVAISFPARAEPIEVRLAKGVASVIDGALPRDERGRTILNDVERGAQRGGVFGNGSGGTGGIGWGVHAENGTAHL